MYLNCSNSIMIKVETKKIRTVKEVWIPGICLLLWFYWEDITKHFRQCFSGYLHVNILNFIKNNPLRVLFSTFFSVCGYLNETLSLVFDIHLLLPASLLPKLIRCSSSAGLSSGFNRTPEPFGCIVTCCVILQMFQWPCT